MKLQLSARSGTKPRMSAFIGFHVQLATLAHSCYPHCGQTLLPTEDGAAHVSAHVRCCATLCSSCPSHAAAARQRLSSVIYDSGRNTSTQSLFHHVLSLCPPARRFTAASTAPGQHRAASLCFHQRQEGRRKLDEVSSEHYGNKKSWFYLQRDRDRNTLERGDGTSMRRILFDDITTSFRQYNVITVWITLIPTIE